MADKKVMKVACKGAARVDWSDLKPLQKNLKSMTTKRYKKLRRGLEKYGQKFAIKVWQHGGVPYILGGHQTYFTIGKMLEDGWAIPPLAVTYTECADKAEAMRMVLLDVAQFGRVDNQALYEAMSTEMAMGIDELDELYELPNFDFDLFKQEFFAATEGAELPELPTGDKSPYQQMTFTLHDSQVDVVKRALELAKNRIPIGGPNQNSNGNAIHLICSAYAEEHDS